MKQLLIVLTLILTLSCCKDDDVTPINPIDQLPPATQTGANTFGCLLDGKAFLPDGRHLSLDCVYQFVDGGYHFALQGNRRDNNSILVGLGIGTQNLEINQNQTYDIAQHEDGYTSGVYFFGTFINYTTSTYTGKLTITKLDQINQIVSGTFWYDIKDHNDVVHHIREGRFDMRYTQ